ncbi:hypothetical protein [Mucilaginibacter sp.]|uniref:hypothetical protein n=1 Tax=Mucilaginibacter sp. TaxID=1882438 RepID=UPI002846E5B9|nr:hypothetical protein [Mucilaginibacter sp.]MDR3695635.1 hypothetical protein [Mucilaginibacter sp.]
MKSVIKSPYGKFFLYTFCITCLVYLLFINWSKFHYGDEKPKIIYIDSSKKENIKSITPKTETVYVKQKTVYPLKYNYKKNSDITKKQLTPPTNGIISTGANAHNVAGTGNNIGINGDYNVVSKLPQREVDDKTIDELLGHNPNHLPIKITYYPNNECFKLYSELNIKLTARGYKVTFISRWNSMGNDKISSNVEYFNTDSIFYITIYKQE